MLAREEKIRPSYPEESKKRKKRKQVRENRGKKNAKFAIVGVAIFSFVLAVTVLYGYATITKLNVAVSNLESERIALENEKDYMIANLEEIKSTSKIEDKAIIKLGMDYPKEDQIVYLDVKNEIKETARQEKGLLKSIVNSVLGLF